MTLRPGRGHHFFNLISTRHERGSIILTSNKGFGEWGELLGGTVIASAILDRLLYHSHVINIRGESYRLREKPNAGLFSSHHLLGGGRGERQRQLHRLNESLVTWQPTKRSSSSRVDQFKFGDTEIKQEVGQLETGDQGEPEPGGSGHHRRFRSNLRRR